MSAQDLEQRARELLPELPPMAMTVAGDGPDAGHWYRADQMRDYAASAISAALRQQPAPVDPDAMQEHIEWVHATLRANGCCIDGGKCHHRCEPKGECFRQRACVPLSGSRLTDDWKLPAHQPAPVVDDAMRQDAERYRWVRSINTPGYLHFPNGEMEDGLALDALDRAIDAARAQGVQS